MMNELMTIEAAAELIRRGIPLSLAGPEAALSQLPAGNWIAGTIPYFMTAAGGTVVPAGQVFATDLSGLGSVSFAAYGPDELACIAGNAPDHGFALTIIPAGGRAHAGFAANAANYPDAFLKPTVGWVAGVHLSELGQASPKVYDGRRAACLADGAVVAYVALPPERTVSIEIVNLFAPDPAADVLHFNDTSFHVRECSVNGQSVDFAQYLRTHGLEGGRLPLVGDFAGAHINVSLQGIDDASGVVNLYAPVFPGVDYRFARPVKDYAAAFRHRLADVDPAGLVMGCNCVLNFVYGELEGQAIGGVAGPATFGEIAYQLLNQTMVLVRIG
jgi:hypothetical protein